MMNFMCKNVVRNNCSLGWTKITKVWFWVWPWAVYNLKILILSHLCSLEYKKKIILIYVHALVESDINYIKNFVQFKKL